MKNFFLFISVFFVFSCVKKKDQRDDSLEEKPELAIVKEFTSTEQVVPAFKKELEDWKAYKALTDFLEGFKKTSPNEVLSNALELRDLVSKLQEKTNLTIFDTPSFKTRLDILNNEVLRLADMTLIPSITAEEVIKQTNKVLEAFSAINAKINAVFYKKRFEDEIDVDVNYIGLDTTKIDSLSKRAIQEEFLKRGAIKEDIPIFKMKKE